MTTPTKNSKVVKLASPIQKGDETLTEVEIAKPNSGHLRGLNLYDVCQADFEAGQTLLPRISVLDERDLINLEPENWPPLLTGVASFFVNTER